MDQLKKILPSILISLVLVGLLFLSNIITPSLPKYYTGDPQFNIEEFKRSAAESRRKAGMINNVMDMEKDLILPPKTIDRKFYPAISFSPVLGLIWGGLWSVFAVFKGKNLHGKKIIWITYCACLIYVLFIWSIFILSDFHTD